MTEIGLAVRVGQAAPIPLAADFACPSAALTALVGPSGGGKSTVLRAIAGLIAPMSGRITSGSRVWYDTATRLDLAPQARRVGFVFQDYALFPHLTAAENVAIAMGHVPEGDRAAKTEALLELVHLTGLEGRRPAALSGGQKQRVALARALARDPEVLLLDEPFSAVDQVTRRRLQQELAALRRRLAMPILLVTHDLEEAALLADRLVVLHRGRTLQSGAPFEVLRRPISVQVARLMDQRNVFTATILGHDGAARLTRVDWGGLVLEAPHRPEFAIGAKIAFLVPTADVILHVKDRPSRGERENPVSGAVADVLRLGEFGRVVIRPDHAADPPLVMTLPNHAIERNALAPGQRVSVSLLAASLHLMPREEEPQG